MLEGRRPIVVKIDIEGLEFEMLEGASNLIRQYRSLFGIDIHMLPAGGEMTEAGVSDIFGPHRYPFSNFGHVLLCEPL